MQLILQHASPQFISKWSTAKASTVVYSKNWFSTLEEAKKEARSRWQRGTVVKIYDNDDNLIFKYPGKKQIYINNRSKL